MQIDGDIIDLRKITVPLLTIVAKHERVLFNEAGITYYTNANVHNTIDMDLESVLRPMEFQILNICIITKNWTWNLRRKTSNGIKNT
jgi:hypothetical protein